ncbi:CU044_5270 family protein [Streptomyces hiroshimensis]|uniref:CU044_5270 family protein n=1 Tax=Streptomyces hiroshimensis TaxID=66424 RepID=A0ABQ2Z0G2_9ACTN|nr:CU044_5270 family protein [Streptomyces hiroshimensis]GGX97965.1 hypothetical protein GCM10010324_50330 [Streptomyces hiroshimensis]
MKNVFRRPAQEPRNREQLDHEPLDHAEFGLLLPRPADGGLSAARQQQLREHLMAEIGRAADPVPDLVPGDGTGAVTTRPAPRPRMRRAVRIAVPAAAAASAAAVIAGVVLLSPGSAGTDSRGQNPGTGGRPGAVSADSGTVAGTTKGLPAVMDRISLAAERQPAPEPRPDQFIYVESRVSGIKSERSGGKERFRVTSLHPRQVWLSPDSRKSFIYEPEHPFMDKKGEDLDVGDGPADELPHSYASLKALPSDPDALLKQLYRGASVGDPQADWSAFEEIGQILGEQLVPPRISAALYKAAAKIPGVTFVDEATNPDGRKGIAVTFTAGFGRQEWIFDRDTYEYIGQRSVLVKEHWGLAPGTEYFRSAIVRRAVVDAKKELPGGGRI